jgi:anti-anti-sigma factor
MSGRFAMETVYEDKDCSVFALHGEVTQETRESVKETLVPPSSRDSGPLVILDCAKLEAVDTYGIGALVGLHLTMKRKGIEMILTCLRPEIRRALNETRMDRLIQTDETRKDLLTIGRMTPMEA